MCVAGGMRGWGTCMTGGCVHGGGGACVVGRCMQDKRPLKRAVCIQLECILVELVNTPLCSLHNVRCVDEYNLQI